MSNLRPTVAAQTAARPFYPSPEPELFLKDASLIEKASHFCMEYYEAVNEHDQLVRVYTGRVNYEDILHEVEHLYSQLITVSNLNTSQLIVALCDWALSYNMMEVKYLGLQDLTAVAFLASMNKFVTNQLTGAAHEGMKGKLLAQIMGADRKVTVSQDDNKRSIFRR